MTKSNNQYRHLRVASTIQEALNEIFLMSKNRNDQIADCSITKLKLTRDLKLITCYFVPCAGSNNSSKDLLKGLDAAKFTIRKMLSSKVALKYIPEIRFIYDNTFEEFMKVNRLIDEISFKKF